MSTTTTSSLERTAAATPSLNVNREPLRENAGATRPGTQPRLSANQPDLPARSAQRAVSGGPQQPLAPTPESPSASGALQRAAPTPSPAPAVGRRERAAALTRLGFEVRSDPVSGLWARGRIAGHPQPVSFFIPPDFDPTAPVDLVMHLHGFLGSTKVNDVPVPNTVQTAVYGQFDFGRMAAASGRNVILFVPESVEECRTYNAWTPASLATLLNNVAVIANRAGLLEGAGEPAERFRSFAVTAHSGAYWGVLPLKRLGGPFGERLRGLALFDANYRTSGDIAQRGLAEIAARLNARGGVFASVYRVGTATDAPNQAMNAALRDLHQRPATAVRALPDHPVPGAVLTVALDKDAVSHNDALRRHYAAFLRTALPEP